MIRRFVPYPGLAAGLFVMWLLLTQSVAPGQLLLGVFFTLVATWATVALRPTSSRVHSWGTAIKLAGIVFVDILASNLAVGKLILTPSPKHNAAFVRIGMELRNEHALMILALIITATPGTAWIQFNRTTSTLVIHVLNLADEEEFIALIKARYERRLLAIFES